MPEDYFCFSLQHRISQVICSVQPVRAPQFPKLCSFLRTKSSTHFTKVAYFSRCWYFLYHFTVLLLYHQWAEQIILDLKQPFFLTPENFFQSSFFKIFVIILHDIIGLDIFLLSFNHYHSPEILMCNLHWYYNFGTGDLYFFALCYTWTALLSTNQSTEIFSCILLY